LRYSTVYNQKFTCSERTSIAMASKKVGFGENKKKKKKKKGRKQS
jgi:hypothetical protein